VHTARVALPPVRLQVVARGTRVAEEGVAARAEPHRLEILLSTLGTGRAGGRRLGHAPVSRRRASASPRRGPVRSRTTPPESRARSARTRRSEQQEGNAELPEES